MVKAIPVGARVIDSLPYSQGGTAAGAKGLKDAGVEAVALYLGVASKTQSEAVLGAGMGAFGVTLGNRFNGSDAVRQAKALGLEPTCTLFLDVEGQEAWHMPPAELIGKINAWADMVSHEGYLPGLYVGNPQPLTSLELHKLRVYRYWKGQGRCVDRNSQLAEPLNGWCMVQYYPSVTWGTVWTDQNMVGQDYKGRLPSATYR